ncbi:MAG: nucleotidyltransferase domain-containing protein [Dehalococcoidia bacterium]
MNSGASNQVHAIVEEKREAVLALCRKHKVQRLALFGSAVTNEFDPEHSDLDFVVEWEPTEGRARADNYFGLLFGLEELFGRHVDLVEREAVKNVFFRNSLEESQVTLYEAA